MVDTNSQYPASVSSKARDEADYGRSVPGSRIISMDFNSADNKKAVGTMVVVPNTTTAEEMRVVHAYNEKVKQFFDSNGYEALSGKEYKIRDSQVQGQKGFVTTQQNGRGKEGYFHLEPFFEGDEAAVAIINKNSQGYAKVIAETFGTLDGARIIPPHQANSGAKYKGATLKYQGKNVFEIDFAKQALVPELSKIMGNDLFNRGRFAKELDKDPKLKEDLFHLTYAEVSGTNMYALTGFIETMFNRANAYNVTSLKTMFDHEYYAPLNSSSGQISDLKKNEFASNPKYKQNIEQALKDALSGSNVSNFATHNASADVAKEAAIHGHVRLNVRYNSNGIDPKLEPGGDKYTVTFYTKTKTTPEARALHGDKRINDEIRWVKSVGGGIGDTGGFADTPSGSFRGTGTGTGPLLGQGGLLGGLFSSGGLFGTQGGLGALAGSLIGSGAIPTSSISSAISSSLPSALASLPSASTISSDLAESIQSGQGFTPFTTAVQSIASADTPVGRLSAIGDVATQYEAEIKALVPSLAGLNFKEAIPAIVGLEDQGPSQRLVSALKVMEGADPDQIVKLGDLLGDTEASVLKLGENWKDKPLSELFNVERYSKDDIETYRETEQETKNLFAVPGFGKGYALQAILFSENNEIQKDAILSLMSSIPDDKMPDIKGLEESLPTLLSGSLEEITKTPLVSGFMDGKIGQILTGEESKVKSILTDLGASALTEATGISGDTSKTLLAGGTEEEIKKMRKEIGGVALDGFIESNPTLKRIIDWFYNNQHLLTLLGTAGSVAALTSLAGGGPAGGFMAGAGSMMAARAMLGEEGYNEFLHMMRETAGPVFDKLSDVLHETGLADVPIVGSMLTGALDLGRGNPLAAISALSGNFGAAAGIMTSESGIGMFEGMTSESGIGIFEEQTKTLQNIENMQSSLVTDTQVPQDIALAGSITGRTDMRTTPQNGYEQGDGFMADISGEPGLPKSTSPFELLIFNETQYNDWGSTGLGNMVGGLT